MKLSFKIFFIVLIILLSGFSLTSSIKISTSKTETIYGPYTQNIQEDSITVIWETDTSTSNNYVEYGIDDSYGFIEEGSSDCKHHEIIIKPDFSFGHYRVISDEIISNDFKFRLGSYFTENNSLECVFIGDSRGTWDNWAHAEMVADAVNNESPIFVIHGGDMVDNGKVIAQWDSWLNLMMPLMQNSTVYGVLGNHENNCNRFYEIFSMPNNEKWYSFDYGPFHFIVLNDYEPWGTNSDQYKWLENDLATTESLFKIVCFHEPIYCSGGHSPRNDIRKVWEPLFIKFNVKLVLQSHCHYYQRTEKIEEITYVVSGGAGAPLYSPNDAWFVNNSEKCYHYCLLNYSTNTNKLKFTAHHLNGSVFDEFYIDAINAPNPPIITGPNKGAPGEEYDFSFTTHDPNHDDIYLWVDWDDESEEDWLGPFESGTNIILKHTWENIGFYNIKAKSKDEDEWESDWSNPLSISMPRAKFTLNPTILKIFEILRSYLAKIIR
jgi:hypothetical protein